MRNYIKCTAVIISALFMMACQNSAGADFDNDKDDLPPKQKTEYTVTFNNNCPSDNGSVWYMCSDYVPASIKAKEGDYVTLPAFSGEITKYIASESEGVYAFEK